MPTVGRLRTQCRQQVEAPKPIQIWQRPGMYLAKPKPEWTPPVPLLTLYWYKCSRAERSDEVLPGLRELGLYCATGSNGAIYNGNKHGDGGYMPCIVAITRSR